MPPETATKPTKGATPVSATEVIAEVPETTQLGSTVERLIATQDEFDMVMNRKDGEKSSRYMTKRALLFALAYAPESELKFVETSSGFARYNERDHELSDISLRIPQFRAYWGFNESERDNPRVSLLAEKGVHIPDGFTGEILATFRKERWESQTGEQVVDYKLFSFVALQKEQSEMERMVELMAKAGITPVINIGQPGMVAAK
jgi:hypothetical protein